MASYRLIGYENRILAKEDFNDDKKDAGEIGAGHTVTALYEIVPAGRGSGSGVGSQLGPGGRGARLTTDKVADSQKSEVGGRKSDNGPAVDPLKYQNPASLSEAAKTGELFTLKLRYKKPDGDKSMLMETPVKDAGKKYAQASADFKFASAVAAFGMILRNSPNKGDITLAAVQELAQEGLAAKPQSGDDNGYRSEFIELVKKAGSLQGR